MMLTNGYTEATVSKNTLFMALLFLLPSGETKSSFGCNIQTKPYSWKPLNYYSEPVITLWLNLKKSSGGIQVPFSQINETLTTQFGPVGF